MKTQGHNIYFDQVSGYYSHQTGARYLNPLESGSRFPELTELHESYHRELAHFNFVDGIGRIFTTIYLIGKKSLKKSHLKSIEVLLETIHINTNYVHELTATYLSFYVFQSHNPKDYASARKQLPRLYSEVLEAGELAFGDIGDNRVPDSIATIVYACAVCSMNLDCRFDQIKFDNISKLSDFISLENPNLRFKSVLKRLTPYWNEDSLLAGINFKEKNLRTLQSVVFEVLRKQFPEFPFFTRHEKPGFIREPVNSLKIDGIAHGYKFMNMISVDPPMQDLVEEKFGTQIEYANLESWEPIDLSIKIKYEDVEFSDLDQIYDQVLSQEGDIYCHVLLPPESNEVTLLCLPYAGPKRKIRVKPFAVTCISQDLISYFTRSPKTSMFFKIDERLSMNIGKQLSNAGNFVFRLLKDTSPKNILNILRKESMDQIVSVIRLNLLGDNFSILLALLSKSGYAILTPITKLGTRILSKEIENNLNIIAYKNDREFFYDFKISPQSLRGLIYTTYVAVNMR